MLVKPGYLSKFSMKKFLSNILTGNSIVLHPFRLLIFSEIDDFITRSTQVTFGDSPLSDIDEARV